MPFQNKFPLHLPREKSTENQNISLVAADVKQKDTTLGYYVSENGKLELKAKKEYNTQDFGLFSDILNLFLEEHSLSKPSRISIAVPGPVLNGKCTTENLPFDLDIELIRSRTEVEHITLINDLEAMAYGLKGTEDKDFCTLHKNSSTTKGNVAILAPGRGLGEAGMFWDGECLRPFATEGGHSEFSPRAEDELELYRFLKAIHGIVSWESVLSHEGLFNVYRFVRDMRRQEEPEWLTQKLEKGDCHEVIIDAALNGENRACALTVEAYVDFIAREASNLVLKLKATGGLILAGSLAIKIEALLKMPSFYQTFVISDKMENILKSTPIYLLKNENAILTGAAYYGAFGRH
ncbi:glucokinase [Riemerella anatipestifer]|uniref:Glucokinase n=1 Tax=Riemerella anatipestifer TaxID=34085 RepID=A0A1S7DTG9_RIEAN|nr:glucokinase [Riemerella anatipestifer]AQY22400.1 Glucokinase [Riemerella anatipestifer]MCO4303500.1 glucokinase [Riemerella anatipestifer]MCO7352459.1 glucokinase [Riemerella anatipestifer]MCQ4038752.1 glucokinase [Riemerella anatipestifer]MCT6760366.1 glucokinase [Riemerella anatipestifer]